MENFDVKIGRSTINEERINKYKNFNSFKKEYNQKTNINPKNTLIMNIIALATVIGVSILWTSIGNVNAEITNKTLSKNVINTGVLMIEDMVKNKIEITRVKNKVSITNQKSIIGVKDNIETLGLDNKETTPVTKNNKELAKKTSAKKNIATVNVANKISSLMNTNSSSNSTINNISNKDATNITNIDSTIGESTFYESVNNRLIINEEDNMANKNKEATISEAQILNATYNKVELTTVTSKETTLNISSVAIPVVVIENNTTQLINQTQPTTISENEFKKYAVGGGISFGGIGGNVQLDYLFTQKFGINFSTLLTTNKGTKTEGTKYKTGLALCVQLAPTYYLMGENTSKIGLYMGIGIGYLVYNKSFTYTANVPETDINYYKYEAEYKQKGLSINPKIGIDFKLGKGKLFVEALTGSTVIGQYQQTASYIKSNRGDRDYNDKYTIKAFVVHTYFINVGYKIYL